LGGFELGLEGLQLGLAVGGKEGVVFVGFFGFGVEGEARVEGLRIEAWIAGFEGWRGGEDGSFPGNGVAS